MKKFFTRAYKKLSGDELENYHRAVFMNMEGEFAAARRIEYYKSVLRHMGEGVMIGCGVRIINPQFMSLGDHVQIHDRCTLIAHRERGITIGTRSRLRHGVYLDTEGETGGYILIGERVYVGAGSCLHGHHGLEIGDDSLLAQNVTITPFSHNFDDAERIIYGQGGRISKITLGRDCYLGMNVSVLPSADIGDGAVVGAGSVVTKPVPPYSVAVGVPAKVIRKRGEPRR